MPVSSQAQTSVALSVTPTKFDISAASTQTWNSEIRVINTNQFPLVVFASAVNFAPRGEGGDGQFIPILTSETQGQTLAEWITLPTDAITIAPEQTAVIPITITVPTEAPPGGHYAAVLISTQPPGDTTSASRVQTIQAVTTLVFLRVAGDILERGNIREFFTENRIASRPEMDFHVRFENLGNVHVQPRGEIIITNMWGQERGIIPINQRSSFGDVLPEQIRKFTFSWSGAWSLSDMGRYRAEVTLSYGIQSKQFVSSIVHFWVIPWQWFIGIMTAIVCIVSLFVWAIKLYVRRMLQLSGIDPDATRLRSRKSAVSHNRISLTAPIEAGLLDLRTQLHQSQTTSERFSIFGQFVVKSRIFIGLSLLAILCSGLVWWFVSSALSPTRPYEVVIDQGGELITVSSGDVPSDSAAPTLQGELLVSPTNAPVIAIINHSGVAGTAARMRVLLEDRGYSVVTPQASHNATEARTFIVYGPRYKDVALDLSRLLNGALVSAYAPADATDTPITIYVGADRL